MANYLDSRRIMGTDNPNGSFATPTALTDWNNRKQITVNGAKKTADFSDDYSSASGWTVGGSSNIVIDSGDSNQVDFNSPVSGSSNTNEYAYKSLGLTLDDEKFVARFRFKYNTFGSNGVFEAPFVLSAGTSWVFTATQDSLGVEVENFRGYAYIFYKDGSGSITRSSAITTLTTGTDYYFELIRASSTKAILTIYSDYEYTNVHATVSMTIPSTISGLTTLQHVGTEYTGGTGYTYDAELDSTEIYNGITTVENIPSQQTATFTDDFTSSGATSHTTNNKVGGWTANDYTKIKVNGSTDKMDFNIENDSSDDRLVHDLQDDLGAGNYLNSKSWTIDFDLDVTTFTRGASGTDLWGFFGVFEDDVGSTTLSNNGIMISFRIDASLQDDFAITDVANTSIQSALGSGTLMDTSISADLFYFRFGLLSPTLAFCELYSDSARTNLIERKTEAVSLTSSALRYLTMGNHIFTGGDHDMQGTVDNIKLWNGISEVNPSTIPDFVLPIKIQGDTDLKRKTTETSEQLFNTDNFTDADSTNIGVNTTTQRLEFNIKRDGTNDGSALDLGSTLSDTKWRVDYDLHLTTLTESGNSQILHIGLSDGDETVASGTNQDAFTLRIDVWSGGQITTFADSEAQNLEGTVLHTFTDLVINTNYYISMLRYSATKCRMIIFADRARTIISQDTGVVTTTSGVGGLQYFKVTNGGGTTQTGAIIGYIENLRIWDNVTNPVEQETATTTQNLDSSTGWTTSASGVFNVDTANSEIDFLMAGETSIATDAIVYDLENVLGVGGRADSEKWCLRISQINFSQFDQYCRGFIGLSDKNQTAHGNTSQDFIGLGWQDDHLTASTDIYFQTVTSDNSNPSVVTSAKIGSADIVISTDYYMEVSRISETQFRIRLWRSGFDQVLVKEMFETCTKTTQDLRYIKITEKGSSLPTGNLCAGTIQKIEFWNGISSPNASGRKIVFTNDDTTNSAVEYPSKTLSYDPINGDYYGEVKIPTLTTGTDFNLYMYHNYSPSANPDYVPDDSTVTLVQSATNTLTQNTSSDTSGLDWNQADSGGAGLRIASGHALVGKKISSFTVYMKYTTSNSSPAQNMVCKHFGSTPSTVRSTASETPSSSTLSTSYQTYTYNFASPVTIQADDHIMVVGDTDGGSGSWHFDIEGADGDANINFTTWYNSNSTFTEQTGRELRYTLTYFESGNREQSVHDANYKGVWHLDGNSFDSTFYGNNGTNTNVDWEQQNNSVGAVFDGASGNIDLASDVSIDDLWTDGGVLSFTINPKSDGEGNFARVIDKSHASGVGWTVYMRNESAGFAEILFIQEFTTTLGAWDVSSAIIPIGEPTHIQIIYSSNSVNNDPIFIINGIKYTVGNGLAEDTTPSGSVESGAGNNLLIGNTTVDNRTFDGLIDNVKLSDKIRPSSQAIATYNAEKSDSDILTVGSESTSLFSNVETNSIFIKTDTNKRFWYNGTSWVEQA